ncbi:hypothetical protein MCOR27_004311 [Pyricularia oryzae]|uniref:ATP-dependent DNA helicase n=1 Tax=Pyricularia grisea TaxID=148305 RepID=A0ABQ8P0L5_PYRGI|nr:hypothetical protein MCOR02_011589 [Pyricularia oryzae]KAI6304778.1 hypothetical protein MCOR33_000291 [Pyricularia grisea]KAI6263451.1 hypothetical protein MCOR19_000352 [Pyricularia oryzae]KAI6281284.1 hypothetical protein MCOR27_004311 [Pyricularia oryzae]KAI6287573.1 hypothetical protein MCOR26_000473 [Pyricularia oryzae]
MRISCSTTGDFPIEALAFFRDFGDDDVIEIEPPAKRRKHDDEPPIELHQAELVISRKQQSCSAPEHSFTRLIDGDCIRLHESREPTTTALLLGRPPEDGSFSLSIDMPKGIPQDISALINFSDSLSRKRQAGRIRLKSELYFAAQSEQVTLRFRFTLLWQSITTSNALRSSRELAHAHEARRAILSAVLPGLPVETSEGSPQEFYKAAHSTKPEILNMSIQGLKAVLYPFQRRAVRWLLGREGVRWEAGSAAWATVASYEAPRQVPPGFTELRDMHGNSFYASDLLDVATRDIDSIPYRVDAIKGGILSEEMGLGKTLEMIGLILLHSAPPGSVVGVGDNAQQPELRRTGATLIITPTTLRAQWVAELKKHAPSLSVMIYQGMKQSCVNRKKSIDAQSESAMLEKFMSHDVVIMTYHELRAEIHFASPPPDRSRRRERKYTRPLSPLVQCLWWRVCLDEAQEVDSGVSKAAILARTIPRVNAWAITGTPIKDDIMDLKGLLMFLHCEPFTHSSIWGELVRRKSDFHAIFNTLALRHSKQLVRDELDLPLQKRYVINIPFNAVEDQYYQRLFRRLVKNCDLNEQGEPMVDDWDPKDYTAVMRNCLDTLRKAALHPHVGAGNQVLPRNPLRTVMQVLDHMLLEAGSSLITKQRALLVNKITQGQLLENSPRKKEALEIWQQVLKETEPLVKNVRQELNEHQKYVEKERKERQKLEKLVKAKAAEKSDSDSDSHSDSSSSSAASSLSESSSPEAESLVVRLDKVRRKLKSLLDIQSEMQRKLRSLLEIEHKVVFFIGNAYFQIKSDEDITEPDSEEFKQLAGLEDQYYSRAKKIRQEILQEANHKATRMMNRIEARAKKQDFAVIPELRCDLRPGVETMSIVDRVQVLCETLNDQANWLDEWRERLIGLVCKPLIDEEEEVTGDEYGDSTKVQEEIIVYVQVIRATIADRLAAVSGQQVSKLVIDETRVSLANAAKGKGPAPELLIELLASRDKIAPGPGSDSIRGFLGELRSLATSLRSQSSGRAQLELSIVEKLQKSLSDQSWDQTKALNALESEIDRFTTIMNARVDYYRQLQAISDDVSPFDVILDKDGERDEAAMTHTMHVLKNEEERLAQIVEKVGTEHRYLINLKNAGDKEESRICPICQTEITNGVMTMCGHQFDKDCLLEWLKRAPNCPTCKRGVQRYQLHPFVLKTRDLKLVENDGENGDDSTPTEANSGHQPTRSETQAGNGIYATFNSQKLAQIQSVELVHPSFTTKVDAIVRHILWLRLSEPGAKSIIFSQYTGFFGVLSAAFTKYQIGFSSIGEHNGIERFKQEAGIECFFLHARAQSSGLNLVNANHVILCEPLLNTALELQAIARVDRIGQKQDTTVWLYMVEGTVEPTIYNLSVQRRLEHMDRVMKENADDGCFMDEKAVEAANSLEMQQASLTKLMRKEKGTAAGEEIPADDLWTCIFGHVKKAENDGEEEEEDRLRNDVVVRRRLLGDAVEQRMDDDE